MICDVGNDRNRAMDHVIRLQLTTSRTRGMGLCEGQSLGLNVWGDRRGEGSRKAFFDHR